jgi:Xaa-Pro aminopeptidase
MSDRADRLTAALPELGADLIVVTSLVNVRYLTGYTGSNGLALVGPDTRAFITDFRYAEQSAAEVDPGFDRRIAALDLLEAIEEVLPGGALRLAFEDGHVTVRSHRRLRDVMPDRVELVAGGDAVDGLRRVKDTAELDHIRAAAELADDALREILEQGLSGRTEVEVATALEHAMGARGARAASFDSIVAAGAHGALPHARPRDERIGAGELVVIDWGAELDGYCSDCTRTVATGALDEQATAAYELVLAAQLAGLDAVRAGVGGREADAAARAVINDGGHAEHFGHGLGHGVGMEVHEAPRLSQRSEDVLGSGDVVTVEPGVYLPGRFGIRIEDLVVVAESGREILTSLPKDLVTVG